jgi:hypothetical protein
VYRRLKFLGSVSNSGTTSYTVNVVNVTDNVVLDSWAVTAVPTATSIIDVGVIEASYVDHEYIMEVSVERNNGSSTIEVKEVVFYKEG